MFYRRLGRTGLKISVISIGGSTLTPIHVRDLTIEKARKIISFSIKKGMNLIDIGKDYDESFFAKALGKYKKIIHINCRSSAENEENLMNDIKDSVRKLGVKPISIYQVSTPDSWAVEILKKAKSMGLIRYTGICNPKIEVIKEGIKTNEFDVVMVFYNIIHRMAERLFKYTSKHDIGVIVAAPLAGGILVDRFKKSKKGRQMTSQNALKFLISNKHITTILVGSSNLSHIEENLKVLKDKSKKKVNFKKLEDFFGKNFCRACRYCERCPQGIKIVDILKLLILAESYGYYDQAKAEYSQQKIKFDSCVQCKKCEKQCPYNLPIIEMLRKADKILS